MKSLFPGSEIQTLVVYPCELDLGLWIFGSEDKMDVTRPFWASSLPDTLTMYYDLDSPVVRKMTFYVFRDNHVR